MNPDPKKILIICFTNLKRDPRVHRQLIFLKDLYSIVAAGFGDPEIDGVEFCQVSHKTSLFAELLNAVRLKAGRFEDVYWSWQSVRTAYNALKGRKFDLIIANDLDTLPLALRLASENGAKVLLDAHEYAPRMFDGVWKFRFFKQKFWDYICKTYLPKADAMMTVCPDIADEYNRNFGVNCCVVTNAPFFVDLTPTPVSDNRIRLIHHGMVGGARQIETMVSLMDHLDQRFTLDFMLVDKHLRQLQKLKKTAGANQRISFRDPVPMPEIARTINSYDMGLYLLSPTSFNNRVALPNKFFEFIQGRLGIAIWPCQEMARIVKKHDLGIVSDDFTIESMAKLMNQLTADDVRHYKQQSHKVAGQLCAEKNREIILKAVSNLIEA